MIACAYLASFYDDNSLPSLADYLLVAPEGTDRETLENELKNIINVLEGRTRPITVYDVIQGIDSDKTVRKRGTATLLASLLCVYHPEVFSVSPDDFAEACISLVGKLENNKRLNHLEKTFLSRTLEIKDDANKYLKRTHLLTLIERKHGFYYDPFPVPPSTVPIKEVSFEKGKEVEDLGKGTYGSITLVEKGLKSFARKTQPIQQSSVVELAVLSSYSHGNLVTFDSFFIEQGTLYLDIEPGVSLRSILTKNLRSSPGGKERNWVRIYKDGTKVYDDLLGKKKWQLDVTKGLKYLHDHGVLHRDLKPSNIIISSDGTAKLIDFGLCYVGCLSAEDKRQKTIHAFTVEYCPPEVILSKDKNLEYSFEVDAWSLGCILLELETGLSPFSYKYSSERKESTLWCVDEVLKVPLPFFIDKTTRMTIADLLIVNPEDRINTATVLMRLDK
jgi:hypothetical protein